jgi:hypothetical protein
LSSEHLYLVILLRFRSGHALFALTRQRLSLDHITIISLKVPFMVHYSGHWFIYPDCARRASRAMSCFVREFYSTALISGTIAAVFDTSCTRADHVTLSRFFLAGAVECHKICCPPPTSSCCHPRVLVPSHGFLLPPTSSYCLPRVPPAYPYLLDPATCSKNTRDTLLWAALP